MVKVLITGGTGLIGKYLQNKLNDKNYEVAVLTRNPTLKNEFKWNIDEEYIDDNAFKNVTHIIHLAGAGIADKRWTDTRKKELIDSRVLSTDLLLKKIKELNIDLKGFISASGIGYYGAVSSPQIFTENDAPKNDFISKVCVEWEKYALNFKQINVAVTILRTGVVLAKSGGALSKMNTPLFLAALGNGKQYMPWIHIDDLCNLYIKAIKDTNFTGVYNAVAPEHHTNETFTKTIAEVINKPMFPFKAPSFILKIILGEMSSILIKGSRVSSKKVNELYSFNFPNLKTSLKNIYNNE